MKDGLKVALVWIALIIGSWAIAFGFVFLVLWAASGFGA